MLNWDEYSKEDNIALPSVTEALVVETPAPAQQVAEPAPVAIKEDGPENYASKAIEEGSRAQ